jgi:hypothetical protein
MILSNKFVFKLKKYILLKFLIDSIQFNSQKLQKKNTTFLRTNAIIKARILNTHYFLNPNEHKRTRTY